MGTDQDWEAWAKQDPYFAVITDPRLRAGDLSDEALADFFGSGDQHVADLLETLKEAFGPWRRPRRALDFGCGTGRIVIPLAEVCDRVVGVDVAPTMVAEAQSNLAQRGITNVDLAVGDDALSTLTGSFDYIHAFIVFQHIPVDRGLQILSKLVAMLEPGGLASIHLTFGDEASGPQDGGIAALRTVAVPAAKRVLRPVRNQWRRYRGVQDPPMQMNQYPLNSVFAILASHGIETIHTQLTDHSGEHGVFLHFRTTSG